jgi:hypothetical protein
MEKTITLDSKIKKYAALACGIAGVTGASAQVVYTDVNPDVVLTPGGTAQYILDLNNDATAEMGFVMIEGMQSGSFTTSGQTVNYTVDYVGGVAAFGSTAPATNGWMGSSAPSALAAGAAISGSNFNGSQGSLGLVQDIGFAAPFSAYGYTTSSGNFLGTEAFVGVRFDISGATHYGWARIEMAADGSSMTVKDYAYESTAGSAINAGDTGNGTAGVNDISNDVSIRTIAGNLRIDLENVSNADIIVSNLSGQNVISDNMNSNVKVISMSDLSTGIYLVNVVTETGTTTKKIYVK